MANVLRTTALAALASLPLASANTREFQGVNWAVLGDNFQEGNLVLHGMDESDDYDTVRATADAMYSGFVDNLEINTIRLPVNTHTVDSTWWDSYSGIIDSALDHDLKVILAYWEDGVASGGRINDLDAWNAMWDSVIEQYVNNTLVYFEPMNEPHGYSGAEWTDIAADWIDIHSSVPTGRILVDGTGYADNLQAVCDDSRLDGTLLSYHTYAFFRGQPQDYAAWHRDFENGLADCASRAVVTEFGSPMDAGFDYSDPDSEENFVQYLRAVTDSMRNHSIGSTYWPAVGGKITAGQDDDWYAMQKLEGSGPDVTVTTPSDTGADRLFYSWGRNV